MYIFIYTHIYEMGETSALETHLEKVITPEFVEGARL